MLAPAPKAPDFRKALSQFVTGVTVVTTRAPNGAPVGLTANSFSSVSLDPPLVLWSLAQTSGAAAIFRGCERYLIHLLAANDLERARRFATRGSPRFDADRWQFNQSGLPLLAGCIGWFECINRSQYDEGDHVILVGRVDSFAVAGGRPLIFHDGRYITELEEAPLPSDLRDSLR
jgi:flavin reductase (DIM6/NTAB) family NADH-FMN oxidoreductase RutF